MGQKNNMDVIVEWLNQQCNHPPDMLKGEYIFLWFVTLSALYQKFKKLINFYIGADKGKNVDSETV